MTVDNHARVSHLLTPTSCGLEYMCLRSRFLIFWEGVMGKLSKKKTRDGVCSGGQLAERSSRNGGGMSSVSEIGTLKQGATAFEFDTLCV